MKRFHFVWLVGLGLTLGAAAGEIPLSQVDLSQLNPVRLLASPAAPEVHRAMIGGRAFAGGFGTWGPGSLRLRLDRHATRLTSWFGVEDDSKDPGPVWLEVVADGNMVWKSRPLRKGDAPVQLTIPLQGVSVLVLAAQVPDRASPDLPGRYNQQGPHSAWGDAVIAYEGSAPVAERLVERPYMLTPRPPDRPRLNGPTVVGARPGHPFLATIPATGERPMVFSAEGLPAGLQLDSAAGRIAGTTPPRGVYSVRITATNRRGVARRELRIESGDRLALTPPMGWNSWNCFGQAVTEDDIRVAAAAMNSSGLIEHGWTYVNIDDFWSTRPLPGDPILKTLAAQAGARGSKFGFQPSDDPSLAGRARDAAGRINSNRRFPDMTGLARYIHSLGLKAGIYSSPGPLTCGGCSASYGHEAEDAARFAQWGFDYLKYDWCTYGLYGDPLSLPDELRPYRTMGEALANLPRDIVFSLCQYGKAGVWKWGAAVGGNCWRTTNDISDTWSSVSGIGFSQSGHGAYAGPGHWNDPDMLVLGWLGWGRGLSPTHLTPDEQYTHVSLWSLLSAPLLLGCDLRHLDAFTLNLLTNDEVLAVDQDPLGRPAHRIQRDGDTEVWARILADGSMAVGLFNRGEIPAQVTARWKDLSLAGRKAVRDLWRQKDLGQFEEAFSATVPRHGVVLVKVADKS